MIFHQLFWKLVKEKFTLYEANFGRAAKISNSFISNAIYHPMNPDADVTYQTVNLFSSDKCLSASFLMFYIAFGQISTTLSVQVW